MSPLIKNLLLGTLLAVTLGAGYWFFLRDGSGPAITTKGGGNFGSEAAFETREFRNLLDELEDIELGSSLFTNPNFTSLQDYSQPINERPYGRPNPFSE